MSVTASTTGAEIDPDGYTATVGSESQSVGANASVMFTDLAVGNHDVELTGVAVNCSVSQANPQTVAVTDGGTATPAFTVTCAATVGSITATTTTSGSDLDPDGYTVTADGGAATAIGINDTTTFPGLAVGNHDLELTGIASNCTVAGANPQTVTVTDGGTTPSPFSVTCAAIVGDITVTTVTSGSDLDPDGYTVTADGGSATAIGINDATTFTDLSAGNHDVELTGVAGNCSVAEANPQIVAVMDGGDTAVSFTVTCAAILSKIAFQSNRSGNQEIYVMNEDGSNQVNVTNDPAADAAPSWSSDGTKIAFETFRGGVEIYLMNADGSNQVNLTNNAANDNDPAISPDGTKIAFVTDRDGDSEIYVMDADGSNQVNLTNDPGLDLQPAWSSDGTKIAFMTFRDGNAEVYVMNADGSSPVNITNDGAVDKEPTWSPDGTKIAFATSRDGNQEIYVMNADGSSPVNITNDTGFDGQPTWSTDGTKIAFVTDRTGDTEIYSVNADGSNRVNLSNDPAIDATPDWGP